MSQHQRLLALQQAVDGNIADNNEKEELVVRSIAALSVSDLHEQAVKRKELYLNWDANFIDNIHASFGQVLTVMNYTRAFADAKVRQEIEHDLANAVSDCEHILNVVPEDQKDVMLRHTTELKEHLRELEEHEHMDYTKVLNELQSLMHSMANALGLVREKIEDPGAGEEGYETDDIERVNRLRETQGYTDGDEEEDLVKEEDEDNDIPPAFMFPQGSTVHHQQQEAPPAFMFPQGSPIHYQQQEVPPAFMFPTQKMSPKPSQRSESKNSGDSYPQEDSSPHQSNTMSPEFMPQSTPT